VGCTRYRVANSQEVSTENAKSLSLATHRILSAKSWTPSIAFSSQMVNSKRCQQCSALSITVFELIDHDPEHTDANHDVNPIVKCGGILQFPVEGILFPR